MRSAAEWAARHPEARRLGAAAAHDHYLAHGGDASAYPAGSVGAWSHECKSIRGATSTRGEGWRTINGTKVHFGADGKIDKGPPGLVGRAPGAQSTAASVSLVERLRDKVGEDFVAVFATIASSSDNNAWAARMERHGFSPSEAAQLRTDLIADAKAQDVAHAKARWGKEQALAFGGHGFAPFEFDGATDGAGAKAGVRADDGLEHLADVVGGLAAKFPVVRNLIKAGLVCGVRWSPYAHGSGGETASYHPERREILVAQPQFAHAGVLLHEIGHALEEVAPDRWSNGSGWGFDQPSASMYAAAGNSSEQFAEAFVLLVQGGNVAAEFAAHAPKQAAVVREAMDAVAQRAARSV